MYLALIGIVNSKQTITKLFRVMKDWAWNPAVDILVNFLKVFLQIDDAYFENRIVDIFCTDNGLLTSMLVER
jgi:hypothetical protein